MLPKTNRFPLRTEFARFKKEAKLIQGRYGGLLYGLGQNPAPRFAFIVSKKIDKKATARNRIKRLLSVAVFDCLKQVKPGAEGVFLAKPAILGKSLAEVKEEIGIIFKQAGLR